MDVFLQDYRNQFLGEDAVPALQCALKACQPGDTLHLGGGRLQLWPQYAIQREYYVSNNDYGRHAFAFWLSGRRELTVDGDGAELLFHGAITPFLVENCENIVIKNLTVDYAEPYYQQATVTAAGVTPAGEDYFELTFSADKPYFTVENGRFCCHYREYDDETATDMLVQEFDPALQAPVPYGGPYFIALSAPQPGNFLAGMNRYLTAQQLGERTVRFTGKVGFTHTVGNVLVGTASPGGRANPGFVLSHTKNTVLRDIVLYHTTAMGVIAQLSDTVTLERITAKPRDGSGRMLSVKADATHFVNCIGRVTLKDCIFVSMMDDAGNFHGIYTTAERALQSDTLLVRFEHLQQRGQRLYAPGDQVRLVKKDTMQAYAQLTVAEVEYISPIYQQLRFSTQLPPEYAAGDAVENFSRMPEIYISGCTVGNNRPRGFLLNTCRRAVVEDCEFFNMNSAIECAGDANSWFESGPVTDITIRRNRFYNSAYAGGAVITVCPVIPRPNGKMYHHGITIKNNVFRMHEKRFLSAFSVSGLVFCKNRYYRDSSLPAHPFAAKEGILLSECENCTIEAPVQDAE